MNRRTFIKGTSLAALGGLAVSPRILEIKAAAATGSGVISWDDPGGEVLSSSDYELTIKQGGKTWKPFVYYSYNRSVDKIIDAEGLYLKHGFLGLHANQYIDPKHNRDTYAHSWTYFDFEGEPVEVTLRINKNVEGLTLPLKSCGIFPQHLGIKCRIIGEDTVSFKLDRPVKIAIVPNYLQALEKLNDSGTFGVHDGYRNPFFLFVRSPEKDIPDRSAGSTLVVRQGEMFSPEDFDRAKTIWFEPGVHDYSKYNPADPDHYIELKTGQTMYLSGGAYVYGHVRSDIRIPVSDMPVMRGRGTLSGEKNVWTGIPYVTTEVKNVRLDGIHLSDPNNHISHSNSPFLDIAVVGAWHGNTDGQTVDGPDGDPFTGWHSDDCFVMAADTNLKFRGSARIRNYTIWQLNNAEPFWIANSWNSQVDGIYVICYNKMAQRDSINPGQVVNCQVGVSNNMRNLTIKNIICEAPFVTRLFLLQTNYTGPGSGFENILFENVRINTPLILLKSPVGFKNPVCSPVGTITFRNLVINGKKVTNENCLDYFELLGGVMVGKELRFESI